MPESVEMWHSCLNRSALGGWQRVFRAQNPPPQQGRKEDERKPEVKRVKARQVQSLDHFARISAMAKPFAAMLLLGLVIGAGVAIAAHLFVAGIRWCEDWRDSITASGGASAQTALLLPGFCLLLGLSGVFLIRKFAVIDRWQGPADAIDQAHRQSASMGLKQGLASIAASFCSLAGGVFGAIWAHCSWRFAGPNLQAALCLGRPVC